MVMWLVFRRAGLSEVGFRESGHFEKVLYQTNLEGLVTVNGNRKPDNAPGFPVDVMAAVSDSVRSPMSGVRVSRRGARVGGRAPCRKPISYDDFQDLVAVGSLRFFHFDGEAPLDRFMDVIHQFVQGVSLGRTSRNSWDFGPITAFFRLVNHNLDLQASPPPRTSYAAFTSKATAPAPSLVVTAPTSRTSIMVLNPT
jgi:hypothetical protein